MHRFWDKLGISLSFICLVHCIALPFLVMSLPALEMYLGEHDHIHLILAIIIWPTAFFAFIPAYKHHKKKWIPGLAILGLSLISASYIVHELETVMTIIGSIVLVFAHYQNYICNRCHTCHDHESEESSDAHETHNHK